jgi:hypothetical protein
MREDLRTNQHHFVDGIFYLLIQQCIGADYFYYYLFLNSLFQSSKILDTVFPDKLS